MAIFPLELVENIEDEDLRNDKIIEMLNEMDQEDPPFLSNILIHSQENAAVHLMEILADGQFPFVWKLQFLRDEWGRTVGAEYDERNRVGYKPGDSIYREIPINRVKRNGDLVLPMELSIAKKDGSYERKYERKKQFKLDAKGCFECEFDDAVYFLYNWGYNKKTKTAVTKKSEYSREPVDLRDPSKGMKIHLHYWRFAEMDLASYKALPKIGKPKGTE